MRKTRSDKGSARTKTTFTSKSSDAEITKLINQVNAKIRGYYSGRGLTNEEKKTLGDNFGERVQALLHFEKRDETLELTLSTNKAGESYIAKTAESIRYIRDTLARQEAANEHLSSPSKTLAEQLTGLKSFSEKLKDVEKDLNDEDYKKRQFDPSAKIKTITSDMSKSERAEVRTSNRNAVIKELVARTSYNWKEDGTFGEAIDKVYEAGDLDLINDLKHQWTGDLMEKVGVFAHGYDFNGEA